MSNELKVDVQVLNRNRSKFYSLFNSNIIYKVRKKNFVTNIIVSFIIYFISIFVFHLLDKKSFHFDPENLRIYSLFFISIIIGSLLSRKFEYKQSDTSEKILIKLYYSLLFSLAGLFLMFNYLHISNIARSSYLIAMFTGFVLETYYFMVLGINRKNNLSFVEHKKLSVSYLILDGMILTFFSYFLILKPLLIGGLKEYEFIAIAVVYFSWLISAATTHKFIPVIVSNNRMDAFELQVKFYLRIIALIIISVIFLNLEYSTAVHFIEALIGYSVISSLTSMFLFADKIKNKSDEATVVFLKAYEMTDMAVSSKIKNGHSKYGFDNTDPSESVTKQKLEFEYLKEYQDVFSVLDNMLDLKSFDTRKTKIIKSDEPNDVTNQLPESYQLFVNLHVLNDQIKLNDYILDVRNSLVHGGVFVGALLPHHYRYRRYLRNYSFWMANTLYFFDFLWKRVFPKLPVTREIYSTFSKDKDRAISLAEGLGRLVYCGFKILDLTVVDDVVYFAAAKNGLFRPDKKFFYSPIFKMKRVGKGGKIIYVYKLRTMYPYSEFIQDFVYKHNNLETGGKFKDDFRVPVWGKLFRKLWIDELPMLINWVKRDLKLVGVRPISNHYLSLYSSEHQERRKKFKPGLIPPFYADLPETIEEIELSEKRYFDSYEKEPVKTDIKYFFKALNNILIKHKRSA